MRLCEHETSYGFSFNWMDKNFPPHKLSPQPLAERCSSHDGKELIMKQLIFVLVFCHSSTYVLSQEKQTREAGDKLNGTWVVVKQEFLRVN